MAQGFAVDNFQTLEEMASVDVVIGRVVAAVEGENAPLGAHPKELDRELRRVITIGVLHNLAGDPTLKKFDVRTPGWTILKNGERRPLTYSGQPCCRLVRL